MTISLLHLENCIYEEQEKFHKNILAVFPNLTENNINELYQFIIESLVDMEKEAIVNGNVDYLFNIINISIEYIDIYF